MSVGPPKLQKKNKFKIAPWLGDNEGDKVIVYGLSGIGKTTLCSLLPNAAFIGIDDGGRKIKHPVTGKPLMHIPGISTFSDVREVFREPGVFDSIDNIIIDNISELEQWALPYCFKKVKDQKGNTVSNIEGYGFHKGYRHWYDQMRFILQDCDGLVRQGKNIIMVAQSTIQKFVQSGAEDFVKEGPELYHDTKVSIMNQYISWSDHVFRIAYSSIKVDGKKASGTTERAVYVHGEPHFYAKSRSITDEKYSVVSFEDKKDDSIWRVLFNEN